MMKWKKIALLTAPLVIGGTVYALAAGGSTQEQAAATTEESAVSSKVVKTEALTPDELQALQEAKVAPSPDAQQQTAAVDPFNPFVMYNADSAGTADASSAPAPAPTNPDEQFNLAAVKKFEWKTMTTQGELKVEFKNENGKYKLEGQLNGRKIEVEGQQALALLAGLMQNAHLNDALTATMQGKQVALDAATVNALQGLKVELEDGRKIESKAKGNPKAEGRHDNGNHYGQEKNKQEKEKKDKGSKHDDEDDDGKHGNGKHGHDD